MNRISAKANPMKTDEQVLTTHDHLEMMKRPRLWPQFPLLPLKRRAKKGRPTTAILTSTVGHQTTVVLVNIFEFVLDKEKDLDKYPKEEYDSYEAICAAGWRVD